MKRKLIIAITAAMLNASLVPAAEKSPDTFSDVVAAAELTNLTVIANDGVELGTISDVVVDRDYGRVAFIAIRSKRSANLIGNAYYLPPETINYSPKQQRLTCSASFEDIEHYGDLTDAVPMTLIQTESMAKLYGHYKVKPYWPLSKNAKKVRSLITVDELDGRIVRDSDWRILARVNEVMVEPEDQWRVAYLSLGALQEKDSGQRLAVPMAAFAQQTLSPTWLLDVSSNAKLLNHSFERGDWPLKIDRGWTEFVHVKYGKAPDGGLQDLRHESE